MLTPKVFVDLDKLNGAGVGVKASASSCATAGAAHVDPGIAFKSGTTTLSTRLKAAISGITLPTPVRGTEVPFTGT